MKDLRGRREKEYMAHPTGFGEYLPGVAVSLWGEWWLIEAITLDNGCVWDLHHLPRGVVEQIGLAYPAPQP